MTINDQIRDEKLLSNQQQIIEQADVTYFPLGKPLKNK